MVGLAVGVGVAVGRGVAVVVEMGVAVAVGEGRAVAEGSGIIVLFVATIEDGAGGFAQPLNINARMSKK